MNLLLQSRNTDTDAENKCMDTKQELGGWIGDWDLPVYTTTSEVDGW